LRKSFFELLFSTPNGSPLFIGQTEAGFSRPQSSFGPGLAVRTMAGRGVICWTRFFTELTISARLTA
jgi:hypothetical protein